jgi:hypothetical protein
MIGSKVKEYLNDRQFTFNDVMNLEDLQEQIINEIVSSLTKEQKIDIVWETIHKESGTSFNRLVDIYARVEISKITREILVEKLGGAAVVFNDEVEVVKPVVEEQEEIEDDTLKPIKEQTDKLKELVNANKEPMSVEEMKREGLI